LTRVNEIRVREKLDESKQIAISAIDLNGDLMLNTRFAVKKKKNNSGFFFEVTSKPWDGSNSLTKDHQNINIPESIAAAIIKVGNDEYNPKAPVGGLNGLGLDNDPTKISSTRITWINSRASGRKLPKGMLYVMGPSLLKGDLRVYTKSGKPVMSISRISPAFQRIVRDVIDRNTFSPEDFSSVEPKESADVNHFITISKPVSPSGIDRLANADTIWKLKKRYEVLVGQLSAGNDGLLVRNEMEEILRSLMRMHAINPAKAKDLIKSLHDY
jgi:hypothetical protein